MGGGCDVSNGSSCLITHSKTSSQSQRTDRRIETTLKREPESWGAAQALVYVYELLDQVCLETATELA